MSNDSKQINKVAKCVRTLLEMEEGIKVPTKYVAEVIKEDSLDDVAGLKVKVMDSLKNDMTSKSSSAPRNERRERLEDFFVSVWPNIKDDEVVREALLNTCYMGRVSKDKKKELREQLLKRCEGDVSTDDIVDAPVAADDDSPVDDTNDKYDF